MSTASTYKYGLTLSGGGARGYAHIGVLKALEEHHIKPEIISGTSMGAIIGALIANGYTANDIETFAKNNKNTKIFNFGGLKFGLSTHKHVLSTLKKLLPPTFEDLKLPFYVSTTNLTTAKHQVFSSGELYNAILASISIPLIFKPIKINDSYFADGGLVKNLPASVIRNNCEFLIGSHVNHMPEDFTLSKTSQLIDRCVRIAIYNTLAEDEKLCDAFVNPKESGTLNVLNFKAVDKAIEIGYNTAIAIIKSRK